MGVNYESSRLAEKERHFREFSVWPTYSELHSEDWLSNFLPRERAVAERLLINFCFFNERMTDALLCATLLRYFSSVDQSGSSPGRQFSHYVGETAFVICEGEVPSPTDSGHIFARKLRDRLGVPEQQIFRPKDALSRLTRFSRFVFIDDFTGSGNQFLDTWEGRHDVRGANLSFATIPNKDAYSFAYCCCIAAIAARKEIRDRAPGVHLLPAHQLTERHNTTRSDSSVWENFDAGMAIDIIKQASRRAGYDAEDLGQSDWRGFHGLGLALAFNHGIPDASLPIFFSRRNGWKPLIARAKP